MTHIELEDGKYTVIHYNGDDLHALRHGEPWRDLTGDGLVLAMANEVSSLRSTEAMMKARNRSLIEKLSWMEDSIREMQAALDGKRGAADAL